MSVLHFVVAGLSICAAMLYGERSLWLARKGTQDTLWAISNRAAWFLVPIVLAGGFIQLGVIGAPFVARHAFAGSAMVAICVTQVGLRGKSPT